MKILIHIPKLVFGGAEKVLVDFSKLLVDKGHEVEVIETYEGGPLLDMLDSRVKRSAICSKEYTDRFYVSFEEIRAEKNIIKLCKKVIKKFFIKIVGYERLAYYLKRKEFKNNLYDVAINYLELESAKFCTEIVESRKKIQWIHIDVNNINYKSFIDKQQRYYKKMDKIICVSEWSEKSFLENYPRLENKLEVIYNFYDTNKVIEKSNEKIGNLRDSKGQIIILSIGRLVESKGYLRSIKICKMLVDEGLDFKWIVLGEGGQREELEREINRQGLKNRFILRGTTSNPYAYIKACDIFTSLSYVEGFSTVIIEAKILKKPVIATDVCGVREQIINNETGIIVQSEKEIYGSIKRLILDSKERNNLSKNDNLSSIIDNEIKYQRILQLVE